MTRKVLIIEDHAAHAEASRRLLEQSGYAVRVVEGGTSGLETAQYWGPDAILMDAAMPGMSGLEAVSRLRQDARTRDIPVIATAVTPAADELTRGLLAGFARYLTKPVSGRSLLSALDEIIDARDRASLRALAGDLGDLTALIEIEDRERVQAGLLEAIRRRIPADVMALRCQDGGAPHVLLSLTSPVPHAGLLTQLAPDLGIDPQRLPRLRVVACATSAPAPADAPSIRARAVLPLCHADTPLGVLVLGSFTRDSFTPAEEQALCELTPAIVRVCCRGLHVSGPDPATLPEDASAIDVGLVLADPASMAFWQGRMEECLPGVRVHVFGSAEQLAGSLADLHVVLVAPVMRADAETLVRARSRTFRAPFPLMELCAAEVGTSEDLLRSMLQMAVLTGFGHGRRSGRLLFTAEDGSTVGEVVFRDGRVEWASRQDTDTCLVRRLTERSTKDRSHFVRAVRIALEEGKPVLATVAAEGLLDPDTIRAVLSDYVATIIRELLRTPRLTLSISTALPAKHFDASFDLGDLALGLLDA